MVARKINKAAVIGMGMMGSQLAEALAVAKIEVAAVDATEGLLQNGLKAIGERLGRFLVSKGKMTQEEKAAAMERIRGFTSIEQAVKGVDFAIEAVPEKMSLKKEVFEKMDRHAPPDAVLASNTSFQNISEIASATKKPDRVVGMHFFNPINRMRLVEVVRGARTSQDTIDTACALVRELGKEPVVCKDTSYGFLANRAYTPMIMEAAQMVWERVAPPEEIDKALKLGYNLPMGPLEMVDFVGGWPIFVSSEQDAIRELGPEKGRLNPLVRAMSRAGYTKIYDYWRDVLSKG
ncbi:MAG: 3-hydroxyacyl-CoA dehydrogenase family protein [Dehalococcoidia bacterium]|nr:3-hydroxyacyl-CoA dehydrogenase family protein [Dehalococcoidia bacterium]